MVKRLKMKKFSILLALCCILFAGCGRGEEPAGEGSAVIQQTSPGGSDGSEELTNPGGPDGTDGQGGTGGQSSGAGQDGEDSRAQQSTVQPQDPDTEEPEILARREQILDMNREDGRYDCNGMALRMQFFRGEPVLLFLKEYGWRYGGEEEVQEDASGLYVYKTDGSSERMIPGEPLSRILEMEEVGGTFLSGYPVAEWYLDEEGCLYLASLMNEEGAGDTFFFLKADASGELVFLRTLDQGITVTDFLCLEGGKMYAVLSDSSARKGDTAERVVEFDPETGEFSDRDAVCVPYERRNFIDAYGEGEDGCLYLYGYDGIQKVEPEDGSLSDVMLFAGSTYSRKDMKEMRLHDFRMLADGSAELLHFSFNVSTPVKQASGMKESIYLSGASKTPVVLRAAEASGWLKEQAAAFNSASPSWRVVLEELGSSGAPDAEEYARQTGIEIAAGKGPDILCGDLCGGQFADLAAKGALADLGPLLSESGMGEEDFLPAAFGSWREGEEGGGLSGIYGISPVLYPYGYKIRSEVLEGVPGNGGVEDISALLDALEAWGEEASYYAFCDAGQILELFLEGSGDLWGMVDWEAGSCDFGGELFGRMLEAAGRFAYDPRNRRPSLVQYMRYDSLLRFDSAQDLEKEGMRPAGVLSGEGCSGASDMRRMLAVNQASAQKDGAWEFLRFLLGEEAQLSVEGSVPVNRAVLEAWAQAQLEDAERQLEESAAPGDASRKKQIRVGDTYVDAGEMVSVSKYFTESDLSGERVEEYLEALMEVKPLPVRTREVLDIVLEEAGGYFGGDKDVRETAAVVENRVQLYLDEHR